MKIGFVFTNFNNSSFTKGVVQSLENSPHKDMYQIVIVDNKSESADIQFLKGLEKEFPRIKIIFNDENVGYFRGLNVGLRYLRSTQPELNCIVVGNNDLVFPEQFYDQVKNASHLFQKYPVICPDLLTLDGVHQNPHVIAQIGSIREKIWDLYYWNYHLALVIKALAGVTKRFTERKDYVSYKNSGVVYQGYGACYILTPLFFKFFEELWAPTFLMGEEFFLWKQVTDKGMDQYYDANILVHHHDHATMSKIPSRKLWEISRESHRLYRKYVS